MAKKITKHQANEFNNKFIKGIIELGAIKIKPYTSSFESFKLNTIVGELKINLPIEHTFIFYVFSCFEDVEKAKLKFDCNPHSGKYNFMTQSEPVIVDKTVELAIMFFESTLLNTK